MLKALRAIQEALLNGKLDSASAERVCGPVARTWNDGRLQQCDTSATSFADAIVERAGGSAEITGVQLELRQPVVSPWSEWLDALGEDAQERGLDLDNPGGPLYFTLAATRDQHPGVVILDLDPEQSTLTAGRFGERTPLLAAVSAVVIRRVDI